MIDAEKEYKEAAASHRVVDSAYMDGDSTQAFYDPSKESFLTRAGLNAESFKRAPGPLL
jgi:amino acid transporter